MLGGQLVGYRVSKPVAQACDPATQKIKAGKLTSSRSSGITGGRQGQFR